MTKTIFKSMLAVSATVLVLCVLCISYVLYGYFGEVIEDELKVEAGLISQEIEADAGYLQDLKGIKNRITLVAADGTVRYDSQANADHLENHAKREEIKGALEYGEAFATRYSDTLSIKTIYYAKRLQDGSVLRIAQEQSMAALLLRGVIGPVVLILLAVIVLAMVLSRTVSRKIVAPINEMNPNDRETEEPYPELAPLVRKIRQQNQHIQEQMDELERRQKEFIAITENMSEGFLLIDTSMEILSYNTAALQLLGDGQGQDVPKTALELNRSRGFRTAAEEALAGRHSLQPMETESRFYHIMANPVWERKHVVGAVIIAMDVTEKEQRDQLRREFTSNVSHELKTPLTTIYGVSDMMAEGIVKPEDLKDFGASIRDESGRMIHLIEDIIQLSRLDEGGGTDELVEVDLMNISRDVIDRLKGKAAENQIRLYLEGVHGSIYGIPSLCEEIVYNLCENAIKYNKEGGSVTIRVAQEREHVVLQVEDTGIGIPYEFQDRIFERFFRVDKSHSREVGGTGLGLSIVKHAVQRLGGSIRVDSVEQIGTKMIVTFANYDWKRI